MPGTNGTDEGVLRAWLDREASEWDRDYEQAMADTVNHLQIVCFVDTRENLLASGKTEAEIGETTLQLYEDGIVDIFQFARASGAISSDNAWARVKTTYRKLAIEDGATEAVRQALDDGLYRVDEFSAGDAALYTSWKRALMLFLYHHAASQAADQQPYPGRDASEEEKFTWAYACLEEIEDHAAFHITLASYLYDPGVFPVADAVLDHQIDEILTFETGMMQQPRFDLIMNTGLRWLVGAVERD